MAAYHTALHSRVDCIEIDVSRSSDGILFALHDRDLQQISGNSTSKVGHLSVKEYKFYLGHLIFLALYEPSHRISSTWKHTVKVHSANITAKMIPNQRTFEHWRHNEELEPEFQSFRFEFGSLVAFQIEVRISSTPLQIKELDHDQNIPTVEDALKLISSSVRQIILDAKVGPPSYEKGLAKDILSVVMWVFDSYPSACLAGKAQDVTLPILLARPTLILVEFNSKSKLAKWGRPHTFTFHPLYLGDVGFCFSSVSCYITRYEVLTWLVTLLFAKNRYLHLGPPDSDQSVNSEWNVSDGITSSFGTNCIQCKPQLPSAFSAPISRHIISGKGVAGIGDKHASLANSSIANGDALDEPRSTHLSSPAKTTTCSIQGHRPGVRSVNAVVDWQQQSGNLYASGEISSIMVWDQDKEQLVGYIVMKDPSTGARNNLLRMRGASVVGVFHPLIDEKLMKILHGRNKKVYAWTVDDQASMKKMLYENVDAVVTSNPTLLQHLMQDIRTQCLEEGFSLS
ncbi:hypothetical protein TEA_011171 [Camellia sinensis var. sinensis]|uniref:glycerophosphodiester phosphodiesterase n=1 Tax=Camellia sinensis var. sinensis TaxID=542762 RepID=A0A4S4EWV6_CAMSN|nr:hypothetical protein TEA_011171 [Camellia sinensis var. sinensis]